MCLRVQRVALDRATLRRLRRLLRDLDAIHRRLALRGLLEAAVLARVVDLLVVRLRLHRHDKRVTDGSRCVAFLRAARPVRV